MRGIGFVVGGLAAAVTVSPALAQAGSEPAPSGTAATSATSPGATPEASIGASVPTTQPVQNDDIIVTATRKETTLQKTPIAVSVFSQTQLDRQQAVNVADIQRFVPSLQFTQQADNGAVLLTLRGIGNDGAFTDTADPEVAIYVDGIYSPRTQGGAVLLYDLDRVEVLRGPQGTLFGRNTTAGAISLITAKPRTDAFSGYLELLGGSYDRFGTRGAVNIPITDTLAVRASFATEQHDGYASYQPAPRIPGVDPGYYVSSGKRYYGQDQKSGRVSVLWNPTPNFRWSINAETFFDKGGPDIPLRQHPTPGTRLFSILADTAPDNDRYAWSIRSTMDYEINDYLEATYIAGANRVGGTSQSESDDGIPPILAADGTLNQYASEAIRTVESRNDYFSHELQIKSRGSHRLSWIVGGLYSHERNTGRADVDDRDGYRGGPSSFSVAFIGAGYKVSSYAGFGQATFNVSSRFRVTGGLRYSRDDKSDSAGSGAVFLYGCPNPPVDGDPTCRGVEGQYPGTTGPQLAALLGPAFFFSPNNTIPRSFSKVTYLGRAEYDVSPDILAYGSVSTGFKSGIIDSSGVITEPESLTDYEIGLKTRLFDRRLTLNAAAYYYDFAGFQTGQIRVVRDADGNILSSGIQTLNAKGATAYGFEVEAVGAVTPRDHIQLSAAVQKTRLRSLVTIDQRFDNDPTDVAALRDLAGNELPHAPRFSATLTYEHDFALPNGGKITPRGTVHYETSSYLSIFNGDRANRVLNGQPGGYGSDFDKQKAYTSSDLAIRYTAPADRYVLEGFVENVENGYIRTNATVYPVSVTAASFVSLYKPPRTYGARLKVKF